MHLLEQNTEIETIHQKQEKDYMNEENILNVLILYNTLF